MAKADEYRKHAQECRILAKGMKTAAEREQLLRMADAWERFAAERERLDARSPGTG
jgi:hypothetical protein